MKIYKYQLHITSTQTISLPHGFSILDFQLQKGEPMIWVLCDPEKPKVDVTFAIYGTGHEVESFDYYVGTVQMPTNEWSTSFVWHLFVEHIGAAK